MTCAIFGLAAIAGLLGAPCSAVERSEPGSFAARVPAEIVLAPSTGQVWPVMFAAGPRRLCGFGPRCPAFHKRAATVPARLSPV